MAEYYIGECAFVTVFPVTICNFRRRGWYVFLGMAGVTGSGDKDFEHTGAADC
ncbi:MAG TPA: hypothetical protein VN884_06200 [Candidatus Sulfotelmatobacter sp.]|jgi:hypothetical protein|nr:hypothetical protein [Candidatus Sulfotelmatobacter sp.]